MDRALIWTDVKTNQWVTCCHDYCHQISSVSLIYLVLEKVTNQNQPLWEVTCPSPTAVQLLQISGGVAGVVAVVLGSHVVPTDTSWGGG